MKPKRSSAIAKQISDYRQKYLPTTLAMFPVSEEDEPVKTQRMKGVALMMAIMIISIMMMFAADFIVSSTVDLTMASAERDNVKAEYVAKSGANWAIWLNLFDYGLEVQFSSSKDPTMKATKDAIGPLWDKLNMIFSFDMPLDLTETSKFMAAFGMNALLDSNAVDMLQSLGGELGIGVQDEGGKINLNVCYQSASLCKAVMAQLLALMTCTDIEQEYLKEANIRPEEIVAKIQDWIDNNAAAEANSGSSSEDDPYQKRRPPHKAKNSPLDTVDELKVVDGWTDDLHAYFSPYLTVYPFVHSQEQDKSAFKLNVNALSQDALRCLFSREVSSPEAKENFAKKYAELLATSGRLANSDSELSNVLKGMIGYQSDAAEVGKEESDKSTWLTTKSRVFRLRAKGIVGSQTKVVEYVMERQSVVQRKANNQVPVWKLDGFFMR
jgi:type II secretory pathway component PulK